MGEIIILPEEVSEKIAAGEVIEGPYSVVRELLDNSLDSEANYISITINNGGKDFILVTDNGVGMSREDAILSIQKHATSKIKSIEDLNEIITMGFRGEALSSICAVSDFTVITKKTSDDYGTKVTCSFGRDIFSEPSPANDGTQVTVRNLFYNFPARRKFLKSNQSESTKIKDVVLNKAICFFERGFSLKVDDRIVYNLSIKENYRGRIEELFGGSVNNNLIDIFHEGELFSFQVYISNKNATLANRGGQFFFVNRRPVADRSLSFVLNTPAKGLVPSGRYLYAFVFITIPPALVDVNVHPAKKEIRIKIQKILFSALYNHVLKALQERFYGIGSIQKKPYILEKEELVSPGVLDEPIDLQNWIIKEKVIDQSTGELDEEKIIGHKLDFVKSSYFPGSLARLKFIGSIFKTYIAFEDEESLFLIDQHAAHERVIYERIKRELGKSLSIKSLLIPISFTPPGTKYDEILDYLDSLRDMGIGIEPFDDESFNILTLPSFIPDNKEDETISLLMDEIYAGKVLEKENLKERFIKLVACRSAIKEGNLLNEGEAFSLLKDLMFTRIPYICPHGRPTTISLQKAYIEKTFKRR